MFLVESLLILQKDFFECSLSAFWDAQGFLNLKIRARFILDHLSTPPQLLRIHVLI